MEKLKIHHNVEKQSKQTDPRQQVIINFGDRTVSDQNFSKVVALPKSALANCGNNVTKLNVKLIQTDTERFLKLTPINTNQSENSKYSSHSKKESA
jgi:hypothetical protein